VWHDERAYLPIEEIRMSWTRWLTWTAGFIAFPYVVFGAAGAITVMALSGLIFEHLRGAQRPPARPQTAAE
jgi:hypothetical protein